MNIAELNKSFKLIIIKAGIPTCARMITYIVSGIGNKDISKLYKTFSVI